jgi:hypothetical protein
VSRKTRRQTGLQNGHVPGCTQAQVQRVEMSESVPLVLAKTGPTPDQEGKNAVMQ